MDFDWVDFEDKVHSDRASHCICLAERTNVETGR